MLATWPPFALVHDQELINYAPPTLLALFQTNSALEKKDAFSAIYNCYAHAIWRYIYMNVSESESDAKDIFCQVWLVALENLDTFEWRTDSVSNDPLRAWLFKCSQIRIKEYRRKKKQDVPLELIENYIVHRLDGNNDADFMSLLLPDVESVADQKVYAILKTLKDNHKTILMLRYYNGMTFAQIGHVLGKNEKATRKMHHDILKRLRKSFGGDS